MQLPSPNEAVERRREHTRSRLDILRAHFESNEAPRNAVLPQDAPQP